MMRPVLNLGLNLVEMIGTFEQAYMDICVRPEEALQGVSVVTDKIQLTLVISNTDSQSTPLSSKNLVWIHFLFFLYISAAIISSTVFEENVEVLS